MATDLYAEEEAAVADAVTYRDLMDAVRGVRDEFRQQMAEVRHWLEAVSAAKVESAVRDEVERQLGSFERVVEKRLEAGHASLERLVKSIRPPEINVHVPRQERPSVNVHVPEHKTLVNFTAPEMKPADVVVHVPEYRMPDVVVNVPELKTPGVTVHVPEAKAPDVVVNAPRRGRMVKHIEYDSYNRPCTVTEEEVGPSDLAAGLEGLGTPDVG